MHSGLGVTALEGCYSRQPAPCQDERGPFCPVLLQELSGYCPPLHPSMCMVWISQSGGGEDARRALQGSLQRLTRKVLCWRARDVPRICSRYKSQCISMQHPKGHPQVWPARALQTWLVVPHNVIHQQEDSSGALSFGAPRYCSAELSRSWHSENMKKIKALFKNTGQSYTC